MLHHLPIRTCDIPIPHMDTELWNCNRTMAIQMLVKHGSFLAKPPLLHLERFLHLHVGTMEITNLEQSLAHALDHPSHHSQFRTVLHYAVPDTILRHYGVANQSDGNHFWNYTWFYAPESHMESLYRQNETLSGFLTLYQIL